MSELRIVLLPNGPLEVTGPLKIVRQHGDPIDLPASPTYLCRCGRSASKPFCDGSHARTAWNEEEK